MKEMLLSFLFALVAGSVINGYSQPATTADAGATVTEGEEVALAPGLATADTSDAAFKSDVLESDIPVLVDFWAEWCGPCKKMLPILDQLASEYDGRIKVVRLDVDNNPAVSSKYKVKEIPTFLFFKDGKRAERFVGVTPKQTLVDTIEKLTAPSAT